MNAVELAGLLNGRQRCSEISKEEAAAAKAEGLVVVYGASDDLMEFDGAIQDEIGAYIAYITSSGLLTNECSDVECPYFHELQQKATRIRAVWCGDGEDSFAWAYVTKIPHATFEIRDGDDPYCRGIVFALADVDRCSEGEKCEGTEPCITS